jgi:hypothetical protein
MPRSSRVPADAPPVPHTRPSQRRSEASREVDAVGCGRVIEGSWC